jgi:hypothetical protein
MTFTKIKLPENLTLEQIFQAVWNGAKSQNFELSLITDAGINETTCMYRNGSGLKCNAGHLIPDEDYSPEMECKVSTDIFIGTEAQMDMLRYLQRCHDGSGTAEEHERKLRDYAEICHYEIPQS